MGQGLLGIEIGNKNIKIVQGMRKGKEVTILNYGIVSTPEGAVKDGFIMDMDSIYFCMKDLLIRKGFPRQNTGITLQGTSIITRNILVPVMEEKELENILGCKKNEYFPIDVSQYQIDYKILNEVQTQEGKKLNILLVAAPNSMIEDLLKLMKRLHLKLKFIDIVSNSISKLFESESLASQGEPPFSILVLDIGGETTTATILSEGNIMFSRSIIYGSDYLNSLIQGNLPRNNYFIQELSRFLEFYYSRNNGKKMKAIYLVGGGAYLKNIDHYIEEIFKVHTKRANSLENINIKNLDNFKKDFLYLVNAVGVVSRA